MEIHNKTLQEVFDLIQENGESFTKSFINTINDWQDSYSDFFVFKNFLNLLNESKIEKVETLHRWNQNFEHESGYYAQYYRLMKDYKNNHFIISFVVKTDEYGNFDIQDENFEIYAHKATVKPLLINNCSYLSYAYDKHPELCGIFII